ncbi:ABC transporter substrate-binding protein [Syntrophomonas palmitatica]|uniref:ABC transporter substrate-binding protein n=1 Tax=Syntrophomonas palmitatica TaxID=402877 RepID=UPI000B0A1E1D|nr:ABC transporter substrate-binding protein [Syntrophomonas palmitatica]
MRFRTNSKLVMLLCLLMVFSLFSGCAKKDGGEAQKDSAKQADTIKLGFLGATTGDVACYGIPGQKGMKMAIDEVNAQGGILGKQVVGIYEDNKGDSAEIANIATKYITRDKVVAMVGDPCTGLTKVAAKIAQTNKVVLLSAGATSTGVVEIGDYIFRNTLLDKYASPAVVEWMVKQKGWKNIAIITSLNNSYSTGLTPLFKEAINNSGGKIVLDETINDGETDFSAQVTKMKKVKPDVLVFTGYYKEGALIMNEAQKQGLDIKMVGGDGLYGEDLMKLGGKAVEEKVIYYAGFTPEEKTPQTTEFIKAYKAKYNGEEPDMFAAQYYDAVMILKKVMEDSKSSDPKVFKNELAKLKDYPGVSGNTTIGPDREPIKSPVCLLTVKDGSFRALLEKIPVKAQ